MWAQILSNEINFVSEKPSRLLKIVPERTLSVSFYDFHKSALGFTLNFCFAHLFGLTGLVLLLQGKVLLSTVIFAHFTADLAGVGVVIGAHRLWSHCTFRANRPLRKFLAVLFTFAGQQSILIWTAWHRLHHKYLDTEADPYNSKEGFFHSHVGWLLTYDHKNWEKHFQKIDLSDLETDPIVVFQDKYYPYLHHLCVFIIPTFIPWFLWEENVFNSFCVGACLRYIYILHRSFLVNSVTSSWGTKPYCRSIKRRENKFISVIALGEGSQNYHHMFPRDYKTSESGIMYQWSVSTAIIELFAWLGWAYDLRSASKHTVTKRVKKTAKAGNFESGRWGWNDFSIPEESISGHENLHSFEIGQFQSSLHQTWLSCVEK